MAKIEDSKSGEEQPNRLRELREKHQKMLYDAEYRLVFPKLVKAEWSERRTAKLLGCPPSSVQNCIKHNPDLARAFAERRDVRADK